MAKILFINPSLIYGDWMHMGIASLSAHLKKHGHKVQLYDAGKKVRRDWVSYAYSDEDNMIDHIKKFKPDLIGITSMTSNFKFVLHLSGIIKRFFDTPIILGGPHPTTNPETCIAEKDIDMICIGEGEGAILELMTNIDKDKKTDKIDNIWIKKNEKIIRNPLRPLIKNLDQLPFPDRELFNSDDKEQFMTGRGCPYSCTYCINHRLTRLYSGQPFVRYRSIDNIFEEIKSIDRKKKIDKLAFIDETFTLDKKRVIEFCNRYEDEIGIPFTVQTRANTMDKEIAEHLKKAGCYMTLVGIESGNDKIRNSVMKRNMSKQQIIDAFKVIRNVGIQTFSFNIIGVPGETRKTIMDTVNFNKSLGLDRMQFSIYFPFKGTDLGDSCFDNGYIKEEPERDYFVKSFLNLPTMSGKMIDSYMTVLPLYFKAPKNIYYMVDALRYLIYPLPVKYKRYPRSAIKRMFPMEKDVVVPKRF